VAGDETDDGATLRRAGGGRTGDAADEEAAVADLVDGGSAAAGPHFEADGGQGGRGQSVCHTENPRKGSSVTGATTADWTRFRGFWKGHKNVGHRDHRGHGGQKVGSWGRMGPVLT